LKAVAGTTIGGETAVSTGLSTVAGGMNGGGVMTRGATKGGCVKTTGGTKGGCVMNTGGTKGGGV